MNYNHKLDESAKYLKVVTRGGSTPKGKRRVYFTCHPKDFDKYFQKVCDDIFKTQDCAIYYTADMSAPIPEQYVESDLGQMNLFVVPITYALLTEKNRAMDFDLAYAMRDDVSIPILPLMMENGIDFFYEKKFGNRQYFSPYSQDLSAIGYEEKLKKYLSSILLDDGTIDRIRKAFDAYIFLSYRKKDRNFANELMKQIHQNPLYRDIAIWYDEFLTPGEDFEENIHKAFDISKLFALLVTPNLVNEKNYVQTTEYPLARKSGKKILPAEWVNTDKKLLKEQYPDIPQCVNGKDQAELDKGIADALKTIALQSNDNDSEHCYLIGLAYLDGIDVEINVPYAIELITFAAEKEYPYAMNKLYQMYLEGDRVKMDYDVALKWAKRMYEFFLHTRGEGFADTLTALKFLASTHFRIGNYQKALELYQKLYSNCCKSYGEMYINTVHALLGLSNVYVKLGNDEKAFEVLRKIPRVVGEIENMPLWFHEQYISVLNVEAMLCNRRKDYEEALSIRENMYRVSHKYFGEKNPRTLVCLNNLAYAYFKLGGYKNYRKGIELGEKAYDFRCEVLGEKHPDTLNSLNNLADRYIKIGQYDYAIRLSEKAYNLRCEVLGESHPDMVATLSVLSLAYGRYGDYEKALGFGIRLYVLCAEVYGEQHIMTIKSLENLVQNCCMCEAYEQALEFSLKLCVLSAKVLGAKHKDSIARLCNLSYVYGKLGHYTKAIEACSRAFELSREVLGENHSLTRNCVHTFLAIQEMVSKS